MTTSDDRILRYLRDTDTVQTASGLAVNIPELAYGEILERLAVLERYRFVESVWWGYYEITEAGVAYFDGQLNFQPPPETTSGDSDPGTTEDSESLHPIKKRIQSQGYQGNTETLERLCRESERTLDGQLSALNDIDSKAMKILRVNIVILGVIIAGTSIAVEDGVITISELANEYTIIGVLFLLLSTSVAALTYTASDSEVGIGAETIRDTMTAELSEQELELALTQSYSYWIEFNRSTIKYNSPQITLTSVFVVAGLIHFVLGMYDAFVGEFAIHFAVMAWVFIIGLALAAELPKQLKEAYREYNSE